MGEMVLKELAYYFLNMINKGALSGFLLFPPSGESETLCRTSCRLFMENFVYGRLDTLESELVKPRFQDRPVIPERGF